MNINGQSNSNRQKNLVGVLVNEALQRAAGFSGVTGQRLRLIAESAGASLRAFTTPCSGSQPIEPVSVSTANALTSVAVAGGG